MSYRKKLYSFFSRSENSSPQAVMLYFFMAGSALLFFTLLLAHSHYALKEASDESFSRLPRIFTLNTILLVFSGFFLRDIHKAFDSDELRKVETRLWMVGFGGLLFCVLQAYGWFLLPDKKQGNSILVILSAIHLLHLLVGIAWSFYRAWYFHRRVSDPAMTIVILADPFYRKRLQLLTHYWFYTEWVWVLAYLYFLWIL